MDEQHENLPETPSFEDFYWAVNERAPFPWQARLAQQVSEQGMWPAEIGVPTGLGKTACLDIAVWWLASQAHLPARVRSAPTRVWWVVNRRLLVDQASEHGQRLKEILSNPDAERRAPQARKALANVAARLRHVAGHHGGEPLHVIRMRGGVTLRRPPNPAQPSVIVSTIPMYGSRLLFRGFGSSRSMRPIDAALAGTDSLVLVDEAHLARHLRDLIPKLRQCIPESVHSLLPARRSAPQVVSLTATGDASQEDRFELDDADLANEIVLRRLDAAKPLKVDEGTRGDAAKALGDAAATLLSEADSPSSCVIFCNTPAVARDVHELIKSTRLGAEANLMLVTGRARQHEADELRNRLLSPETGASADSRASGASRHVRERHLIVVATQTLEVGADLDFEYMVSEQCGVRALTQRLGRLNRLGLHDHARAVYVHRLPPKRTRSSSARDEQADSDAATDGWPVYDTEPLVVLERLEQQGFEDRIDLSPRVIAERLGQPGDDPGRAPEVLPDLLWEWVKTTTPPHGEAPVEPYFSGIAEPQRSVSVIWRAHVPGTDETTSGSTRNARADVANEAEVPGERLRLWPRESQDEIAEVPLSELREALRSRDTEEVIRRGRDRDFFERARQRELQPGDLIVLPSDKGRCDEFGWAPDNATPVADLSIPRAGLPLDASALGRLCPGDSVKIDDDIRLALKQALGGDGEERDDVLAREGGELLISLLHEREIAGFEPDDRRAFLDQLDPMPVFPPNDIPRLEVRDGVQPARIDEFDELSLCEALPPEAMQLVDHGNAVGERAKHLATTVGLSMELADVIAQAGELHDIGKADGRFQRRLSPGTSSPVTEPGYVLMAKSKMSRSHWSMARTGARWPAGGRHEELSSRLVKQWLATGDGRFDPDHQDLLVHLIVSHHGKGRPLVVPVDDGSTEQVGWTFRDGTAASACADLSRTDWGQPARFRRLNEQYGPWGVALLEALVRQADHEVSKATEVQ